MGTFLLQRKNDKKIDLVFLSGGIAFHKGRKNTSTGDRTTTAAEIESGKSPLPADAANVEAERAKLERSLFWWNLAMGFLHFAQAVVALALALTTSRLKAFKLPLTTVFTDWTSGFPEQVLVQRGLMPLPAVATLFSFLSAAAHFTVILFFKTYTEDLKKGINKFRWFEYALSSSVMIALIAQLFGCYDIISLVLIVSINALMNLCGYMMELLNQYTPRTDWTPFWFGCFAGVVPWACIITYLGAGAATTGSVPGFVWAILVCYFISFNSFPITMVMQYAKWGSMSDRLFPGSGYYVGERSYQFQSLFAKTLLVWLVIGGANQPNSYVGN
ncbi:integral membrane protein [Zopfochytrium polystomum]|nr:integral membrane protein [Zopfochytrium polystomum]